MQTASGDVCPAGHYCVRGSSVPTPCPAGFHRNKTGGKGEADCYRCPNGKREMIWWQLGFRHKVLHPLLEKLTLFEISTQAGSRSRSARQSVFPVRLASTASPRAPAHCSAQLVTSVLTRVQTVILSPVLKAPTTLARVLPPPVTAQISCSQTHNRVSFSTVSRQTVPPIPVVLIDWSHWVASLDWVSGLIEV